MSPTLVATGLKSSMTGAHSSMNCPLSLGSANRARSPGVAGSDPPYRHAPSCSPERQSQVVHHPASVRARRVHGSRYAYHRIQSNQNNDCESQFHGCPLLSIIDWDYFRATWLRAKHSQQIQTIGKSSPEQRLLKVIDSHVNWNLRKSP